MKELGSNLLGGSSKFGGSVGGWDGGMNGRHASWHGGVTTPTPAKKWQPPRHGVYSRSSSLHSQRSTSSESEEKDVNYKAMCTKLLKVLSKKIQTFDADETKEINATPAEDGTPTKPQTPPVAAKAKSYQSATPPPTWTKSKVIPSTPTTSNDPTIPTTPKTAPVKARYQPWAEKQQDRPPPPPRTPSYRLSLTGADLAKVGIQVGKTKVFLRHKAFEILERLRSREFTSAATKLNSIFRMYLSRVAYISIRDAYREELRGLGFYEERKEERPDIAVSSRSPVKRSISASTYSLIEKFESQVRAMIHNPLPRSEWGKNGPNRAFKWMLVDGLWVKNPAHQQVTTAA